MRFHQYIPHRDRFVEELKQTLPPHEDIRAWIEANDATDAYAFAARQCQIAMEQQKVETNLAEKTFLAKQISLLIAEEQWFRDKRPFYNVWPIMNSVVRSLSLDIPWHKVRFPFYSMMLQFPEGQEPMGIAVAMIATQQGGENGISNEQAITIEGRHVADKTYRVALKYIPSNRLTINETFPGGNDGTPEERKQGEQLIFLLRLACVISLLAEGEDLITPILLKKDQEKMPDVSEDVLSEWISRKAEKARHAGHYGFDVGRGLESESAKNPTAIGPYSAIRWTGKGSSIPKAVIVKEHLKNRASLGQVPTGFLGWEDESELEDALASEGTLHTVYFLRDGHRPYVKVGYTSRALSDRLRKLATANRNLILLGLVHTANGRKKETEIHRELSNTVRDGEFFYLSNDSCRDLIARHGGKWLERGSGTRNGIPTEPPHDTGDGSS